MIILGIDPGYAIVGCGVIRYQSGKFVPLEAKAITTPAKMPFEQRLGIIYQEMDLLIKQFSPDAMAVEELFFYSNQTTAMYVAQARGVILLSAQQNGVEPFEYTPMQVKQSVVGYGKAEKKQVMQMTKQLLGLSEVPKPDDVADALAIAICHAHSATTSTLKTAILKESYRRSR